ncbi:MAG: hypothetical protein NT067_01085 [Candidatus Diapherotrites archaeon]|nr:hypothetical protein [Candidatus Diapherotrites archaeon]
MNGKSVTIENILQTTTTYTGYEDILKDIYLRAWAKQKFVELTAMFPERLEGPNVLRVNKLFTEMFDKFKPLSGAKAEEEFKAEFEKEIKLTVK